MPIELNSLETTRFGIVAANLTDFEAHLNDVNAAAQAMGVRMLTARLSSNALDRVHQLEDDGYRLMDTLVYYARALSAPMPAAHEPEWLTIRPAAPDDSDAVAAVAAGAFAGYLGHYHNDPRLEDASADAAYVEWAATSIAGVADDRPALVALSDAQVVGFLTLRRNDPEEIEIVLNAVRPDRQGCGVYDRLLARALELGRRQGAGRMLISTQITNIGVQRVWARNGFTLDRSLYTFHKWFDPS